MSVPPVISVVIPNYNCARTIGTCLESTSQAGMTPYEVIVVDDGSTDGSREIIERYPVRLIRFKRNRGASAARNAGAREARGRIIFFTDADCVLTPGSLDRAAMTFEKHPDALIGGTYEPRACDHGLYSTFQASFVNYFETKRPVPDYVAAHAMVVSREIFLAHGGFDEGFMPIIEDVDFSHRLKRAGVPLVMDPALTVGHIFEFTLWAAIRNAFRKSRYWTLYSLRAGDLHRDSGTASWELKATVALLPPTLALLLAFVLAGSQPSGVAAAALVGLNLVVNRGMIGVLRGAAGTWFAVRATAYYMTVYAAAVGMGGLAGLLGRE
jgi:glycosyltransferase involved in cell wall biosynthesis